MLILAVHIVTAEISGVKLNELNVAKHRVGSEAA